MYSGHPPSGLTEADLKSDGDDDVDEEAIIADGVTKTNEHVSRQLVTEPHSTCAQLECNNTTSDLQNDAFGDDRPPEVSLDKWQRFKDLQRAKMIRGTTNKTAKEKLPEKRWESNTEQKRYNGQSREPEEKWEEHWKELTQYFGISDRFKPPPCSRPPLMSGLEKCIESAIAEGDYGKADELSDRLATRELAMKIAQAADSRDFACTKQEAEASQVAQKRRKQIAWGFEAKKRWETKSNMGFM
ncbi:LOW QUALITY PROTEIN: protein FAM204A [Myxocyprinus asiaticus]|uniref:LOW QUALITY PROTEIN: protein FAM204A n=1 Tax=Myxocyprinus asiaticus TaxID=70543 RepID=UPI002221CBD1|nr:LOW QUALITY PROTEIN: protein FAM204A [Myxocyprinus asiaticus]